MVDFRRATIAVLGFVFWSFQAFSQGLVWQTDYRAALSRSKAEGKPMLIFFSGSDWSGWSMKMKREVLENPLFVEKVKDAFLFVEIDFPTNKELADSQKRQNELLKMQFHVQEYPRLILVDEKERELARFTIENPQSLAHELLDLLDEKRRLEVALLSLDKKTMNPAELEKLYSFAVELKLHEEMERLLHAGMKSEDPHFFLLEKYRHLKEGTEKNETLSLELRKKLEALDPFNLRKTHLSLALIDFQSKEIASHDRYEVIRPLEEYLDRFGEEDLENRWRLEIMIAQFYLNYDESVKALFHGEMALKLAPAERRDEVEKTLSYIRKQANLSLK